MAGQISSAPLHNHQQPAGDISAVEHLLLYDDNDNAFGPLLDDAVNGMMEEINGNANAAAPQFTSVNNNSCNETTQFADSPAFGNPMRIPAWPIPPSPYTCSCCQTLREIFHINGSVVLKLEIHGRLGIISHAVLQKFDTTISSANHEYYMFDFCKESICSVKKFLVQYCNDRRSEGCIMLQDPLLHFYNALCTGLDCSSINTPESAFFPHQTSAGDMPTSHKGGINQEEEGNGGRLPKSYIASQRERAGKMTVKDLVKYFHLPISEASKEMKLCPSAIKTICRKGGLERWPHRKIKSIENEIAKVQESMKGADERERSRLLVEIQQLQQKLAKFYQENS